MLAPKKISVSIWLEYSSHWTSRITVTMFTLSRKSKSTLLQEPEIYRIHPTSHASHTRVTTACVTPTQVILARLMSFHKSWTPFSFFLFSFLCRPDLNIKICLYICSNATIEECMLEVSCFHYLSLTPPIADLSLSDVSIGAVCDWLAQGKAWKTKLRPWCLSL